MTEKPMQCPRRRRPGPWRREETDSWARDRWTTDHEDAEAQRQQFRDKHPRGSISEVAHEWIWTPPVPRTCSFCGGVHPEDAIRLLENGWTVEPTGKRYKRYLHPPGVDEARQVSLVLMRSGAEPSEAVSDVPPSPVPPVKVYTWHFTEEHAERFNAAIDERHETGGDE